VKPITGLRDFLQPETRSWLEETILPVYVKQRRWFASKDKAVESIRLTDAEVIQMPQGEILIAEIEARFEGGMERYQLPLGIHFRSGLTSEVVEQLKLCDIDVGVQEACFTDAFALDVLPLGLLACMRDNFCFDLIEGQLRCLSLARLQNIVFSEAPKIHRLSAEQSNSSLVIGGRIIMKLIRRVETGVNPEVEMVRYLTERGYANTPPLLGEVQRIRADGKVSSIIVAQEFVPNQGDAWEYTLQFIHHNEAALAPYAIFIGTVGTRLGQLHGVLAKPTADAAFAPVSATEADITGWADGAIQQLHAAFEAIAKIPELSTPVSRLRDFVLSHRQPVLSAIPTLAEAGVGSLMTRVHGDFHLGQVLVAEDDAFIIDFEGEPAKPLNVRRAKTSPMRDVAGLLRSLNYAVAASGTSHEHFFKQMSAAFLDAYRSIEQSSIPRWLTDESQEAALLDLFLLEKSAYEICYEVANRPTWIDIPLRGLAEIMARVLQLDAETLDA